MKTLHFQNVYLGGIRVVEEGRTITFCPEASECPSYGPDKDIMFGLIFHETICKFETFFK